MKTEKTLYEITTEDVKNVSVETKIKFTKNDLPFIQEKIGNYFGSQWHDAVEYALSELKNKKLYDTNEGI